MRKQYGNNDKKTLLLVFCLLYLAPYVSGQEAIPPRLMQASPAPSVPAIQPLNLRDGDIDSVEDELIMPGPELKEDSNGRLSIVEKDNTPPVEMSQVFEESLVRSPQVAAVRAQLGIAKSAYASALTFPNPSLLIYNGMRAEQTYQLGASIPIEMPWKFALRLLAAKRQVKQADIDIARTLWQFRGSVRRSYLEVVVAQETYQTLTELAQLSQALLNVAQKRFKAGDVPELDVLKARLASSQAKIEQGQGARRVIRAKQQLNLVVGRNHHQPVNVKRLPPFKLQITQSELLPDYAKSLPTLKEFLAIAMDNRLEMKLIKQTIAFHQTNLKYAIASIMPNTQFSIGRSITGNPPIGPKIKNGYFFSVNQELPVFDLKQGEITKLTFTIKQLKTELTAQSNRISAEVSSAYQRMLAAREKIRVYQEHVLEDSNEVARLARRSYEVGQSDITSTLAAQQANVQVRSQYLDAIESYQQSFNDLEQSIGKTLQ
jgi:outer membrane protein TolC